MDGSMNEWVSAPPAEDSGRRHIRGTVILNYRSTGLARSSARFKCHQQQKQSTKPSVSLFHPTTPLLTNISLQDSNLLCQLIERAESI